MATKKSTRTVAMAGEMVASCTKALLDWGEAINKAEAATSPELKDALSTHARLCGMRAMELGTQLAALLRPVQRRG